MSWRVADGVFVESIQGEMVLLDGAGNRYLALNETGAAILQAVQDGCDIDGIVDRLTSEWDVSRAEADSFARSFLDDLAKRGILVGGAA